MSLWEVVVMAQDTCSVSVHLTQSTVVPDHIVLGHRHAPSAGEARKAEPWKASSNLWGPEKTFSAPAAGPRLRFSRVTAAQSGGRPAKGVPGRAVTTRPRERAMEDPGLHEPGRQCELLLTSEP